MQNAPAPDWPPEMPEEDAIEIAHRMYFQHLATVLKEKGVSSKRGKRFTDQLREGTGAKLTITAFSDEILIPMTYIAVDIHSKIDNIFHSNDPTPYFIEPRIVAEALNTLPDKLDHQVLADFLVADFYYDECEDDDFSQMAYFDDDHPNGRPPTRQEIKKMRLTLRQRRRSIRQLYRGMLARSFQTPARLPRLEN